MPDAKNRGKLASVFIDTLAPQAAQKRRTAQPGDLWYGLLSQISLLHTDEPPRDLWESTASAYTDKPCSG